MVYKILITETFEKKFNKLNNYEKERIQIVKEQLKFNPFFGKPLGHKCIREKKILGNRLYYLILEENLLVVLAFYGGKKTQKLDISNLKKLFNENNLIISILLFVRFLYLQGSYEIVQLNLQ